MKSRTTLSALLATLLLPGLAAAYPVDDFERTGIRRLQRQYERDFGGVKRGWRNPPGAKWSSEQVVLRMTAGSASKYVLDTNTTKDPALQRELEGIFIRGEFGEFDIALLDITDPSQPRFAGVRENHMQTPGSVAKVLVAAAVLAEVAKRFPLVADRESFLRTTHVEADRWAMKDPHRVLVEERNGNYSFRPIKIGDRFSVWEWLDHALSRSSSAAATMMWKEATLMALLGGEYAEAKRTERLWRRWSPARWLEEAGRAVDRPLANAGLSPKTFRLRRFFTGGARRYVRRGPSRTSPLAIVQWMIKVEQGRMIDEFSSLELKRLLYITIKRIRYAFAKELKGSAVYFKSGSLYKCKPERGFQCSKYRGNAINILNSLALVETPTEAGPPVVYLVAVMSNELRRNASEDHARLGGMIHEMMMKGRL